MKYVAIILLCCVLAMTLIACSSSPEATDSEDMDTPEEVGVESLSDEEIISADLDEELLSADDVVIEDII